MPVAGRVIGLLVGGVAVVATLACGGIDSDPPRSASATQIATTERATIPEPALTRPPVATDTVAPVASPSVSVLAAHTPEPPQFTPLPNPPDEPESPLLLPAQTFEGGHWYEFECVAFFAPGPWSYSVHVSYEGILGLGIREQGSASVVVFNQETLEIGNRNIYDQALEQVFDQIAASINRNC